MISPARTVRALVVAVTLLLVASGAANVASLFFMQEARSTDTVSAAVTAVDVDVDGDIHVVADDTVTGAVVHWRERWAWVRPHLRVEVDGGRLVVRSTCKVVLVGLGDCDVRAEVRVPSAVTLVAHAGTGDVTVDGIRGGTTAKAGTGDVRASRLSGAVVLHAGTGDVRASRLRSTQVRADSGTGDVRLALTRAPSSLTAEAGTGDVVVTIPRGPEGYDVDATTGTGDTQVDVRTDPSSSRRMRLHSGTGEVRVSYS